MKTEEKADLEAKQREVDAMLAGVQKSWEEYCRKLAIWREANGIKLSTKGDA